MVVYAGIRELKAKLSSYIDKVRSGEQLIITQHGREVAMILPISEERKAVRFLAESGKAHWEGGKPLGIKGIRIEGKAISETILEERR